MQNLSPLMQWLESRTGLVSLGRAVLDWSVPAGLCGCKYLPAMIVFAAILQSLTGVVLWAYYSTSSQSAWESVFYVQYVLPGGWLVRGIHHFSAQLFVALLGLYIVTRVVIGRYRAPREFVFWTSLVLLALALGSCLTGDLLQWTLSGYSATLVRVRFLQMIPVVGDSLFKIAAGGSVFGTLTIPRFLVLHVLIGGGITSLAIVWRYLDYRASLLAVENARREAAARGITTESPSRFGCPCSEPTQLASFWSCHVVRVSLACLMTMVIVLGMVFQKPLLSCVGIGGDEFSPPRGRYCGAEVGAPADLATFDDAARPEWSFRALYHLSNLKIYDIPLVSRFVKENGEVFPGTIKWIPIFVIPGCVVALMFLMPIVGRVRIGHAFNVIVIVVLTSAFGYLTYRSYHHDYVDETMSSFRATEAANHARAQRAIALALEGIPPEGMLAKLKRDPLSQGPVLFKQHCASCHPSEPLAGESPIAGLTPIACDKRSAPNLYAPVRQEWIRGFLDPKRAKSDDYFGKTKFVRGTMVSSYLDSTLPEILETEPAEKLDAIAALLTQEAKRTAPAEDGSHLTNEQLELVVDFSCLDCHKFYNTRKEPPITAPDLRGYMSREWMIDFISDPTQKRFYGPDAGKNGNDRMPSYHASESSAVMTRQEIETLVDWLRSE
ncbi:MAG: cytochrome b N-terminal domain-containing protein [Thermoguttaceae bacterium]